MAIRDLEQGFDYIVVGGGTAGLAVATRLSEDPTITILVIEAGTDNTGDPLVLTPGLVAAQYGQEKYDWNFLSTPQGNLNGRRINQARGRQLGGSSALNIMMFLYPSRANLDAWGELGNEGWSYDALEPYFLKSATAHPPGSDAKRVTGLDHYHDDTLSGDGPIHVSFGEGYTPGMNGAWMETFSNLGLKTTADPRTGKAIGAFQNPASIDPHTKTRSYAVNAYLSPDVKNRSNLVIITDTVVKKILMEKRGDNVVATGVSVRTTEGDEEIKVRTEVILAAGAFQSPQILELSGIGDRKLLERHNIPVIIENSHVGEHLQDHAIVCQSFEVNEGVPTGDVLRDPNILGALVELYSKNDGAGPMGQSTVSCAYAPVADNKGVLPAEARETLLKAHSSPLGTLSSKEVDLLKEIVRTPDEPTVTYVLFPFQTNITDVPAAMSDIIIPRRPENYITVITVLNHPFSRGSVHITSGDVNVKPEWEPNFMSHPLDLELLARNVQYVEKIVATDPFKAVFKSGGLRHPNIVGDTLEKAKEIVRQAQISMFHVSGSCSMRPRDQGGVVNERLLVHGTKNIRIVDASIFPLEPLGNIQSTVYAVAERAADLIKEDRIKAGAIPKV
ncbi:putative Glucose-methanol-choline oxidoreductase N-terminal domain-containing protein [Seiridium cardinale]